MSFSVHVLREYVSWFILAFFLGILVINLCWVEEFLFGENRDVHKKAAGKSQEYFPLLCYQVLQLSITLLFTVKRNYSGLIHHLEEKLIILCLN